ncbi:MAG TPA: DUF4340 domain-containing protein [Verrucomicrobiae bacterium]|nr:DUF4340 domain-containing protein [Verrucomicrobiae bacterium]
MNRKQLLIVLVVGVVLGGIGLYLNSQKDKSYSSTSKLDTDKLLGDFPINDVAAVTIRQSTNEVNLTKADAWSVKERDNYPANSGEIIELARKLWDLRPAQSQKIGESQLARMELTPPDKGGTNSATLVELKGKDGKAIRTILLGKKSMRGGGDDQFGGGGWPNGRWVYLPDKPGTTYLVTEAFAEIEPKPERWLSKDFFKVEKIKSIAITFPEATNSWKLTRETESGEWKLADAKAEEKLDSAKTSSFSYALSSPSFNDVAIGLSPEQTGLDKPTTAVLETFDHLTYTIQVGAKTNDNVYLTVAVAADLPKERTPGKDEKPEDRERLDKEFKEQQKKVEEKLAAEKKLAKSTYLVSNWTVDSLLKERSTLLAEKKEEEKKDETPAAAPGAAALPSPELPGAGSLSHDGHEH